MDLPEDATGQANTRDGPYRSDDDSRRCQQRRSRFAAFATNAPDLAACGLGLGLVAWMFGAGTYLSLGVSAVGLTVAIVLVFVARHRVGRHPNLVADVDLDVPVNQFKIMGLGVVGMFISAVFLTALLVFVAAPVLGSLLGKLFNFN